MSDEYEMPRSQNMLSHLTSGGAVKEHKQMNARKLIREQEEYLRRLSNIRRGMESAEYEIGKVNDYYRGGHDGEKYTYVLGTAAKRSKDRVEKRDKTVGEISSRDRYDADIETERSPRRVRYADEDFDTGKFDEEINRLRRKVSDIALRSKDYDTYGVEPPRVIYVPVSGYTPRGYQDILNSGGEVLSGYYDKELDREYPEAVAY